MIFDHRHYTDFTDAVHILNSHRTILPSDYSEHLKAVTPRLEELAPIRNRVAHSRPLQYADHPKTFACIDLLLQDADRFWPSLHSVATRIKNDPSFVLGVTIPTSYEDASERSHNLPIPDFDDTGFVGRNEQAKQLVSLCLGPYPVITIVGDGGLGKTALAQRVAYDLLDHPDHPFEAIVWSSSKTTRVTDSDIEEIEGAIKTSLGMLTMVHEELAGVASEKPVEEILELYVVKGFRTTGGLK